MILCYHTFCKKAIAASSFLRAAMSTRCWFLFKKSTNRTHGSLLRVWQNAVRDVQTSGAHIAPDVSDCQKNLVEFAPAGANKMSICFVRWRVHRTKHTTRCKCGICVRTAHKLCAPHRAAFSNANPATRFASQSLSKNFLTSSNVRGAHRPGRLDRNFNCGEVRYAIR